MSKTNAKPAVVKQPDFLTEKKVEGGGTLGVPSFRSESSHISSEDHDEVQRLMSEVLGDLDYIRLKEKRVDSTQATQDSHQTTIQAHVPKEKLSTQGEQLLGIIGHCALNGHIAHFYNLRAEIERHIKSVSELGDERLVAAYNYLKSNPSTEAIFIYDNRMVAATRVGGRLVQKNIIAD